MQEALKIAAVAENYTNQLVQAGWTLLDTELAVHSAWSTWQFRREDNEEWLAAFYLFQLAGEPVQYHVYVRADLKGSIAWRECQQAVSMSPLVGARTTELG